MENLVNYSVLLGVAGLVMAFVIYRYVMSFSPGNEKMVEIMNKVHAGAMVFLKREYQIIAIFIAIVFLILFFSLESKMSSVAFVSGAVGSLLAGVFGMQAATLSNARTAQAASEFGQGRALTVAFFGGSVMGYFLLLLFRKKSYCHQWLRHGGLIHRLVCPCRRRHLYKISGRRI